MKMRLGVFVGMLVTAGVFAVERPNVVFILADDLGYGDLGCMGCRDIATPNIDRIAKEGVIMTDFYSNAPVCTPTRAGFMLGRWQQRVGIEFAFGYQVEQMKKVKGEWVPEPDMHGLGLPLGEVTVADRMREAGYVTGAFGKWHLGFKDDYNPVKRGFDEFFGELLGHVDYYRHRYYDGTVGIRDGLKEVDLKGRYFTDLVNERAAAFVKKHAGGEKPFFLYVPHLAVHAPFQAPDAPDTPMVTKETMLQGSRAIYKAMLERVDAGVGMLLKELEVAGVADKTLVVFSSDNGGERWASNAPLFHHKATLWEGGIRVPCLMRWPGKIEAGGRSRVPGITMDLSATFLTAAGGEMPKDKPFDGVDLMPLVTGERAVEERDFCWRMQRSNRTMKAIRRGKWKYVNDGNTMDLLFDLEVDAGERTNLNFRHPEVVMDLKKRMADWEAEMDAEEKEVLVR
jgi:arylsulfatase A-like enzyme